MSKSDKFPEELYLAEIETWRKSSQLHAQNAIEQYKRVTKGLEEIYFEKTRNEAILGSLSDGVIVLDENNIIIIFNKVASDIFNVSAQNVLGKDFDTVFESLKPELLTFTRKQRTIPKNKRKRHILSLDNKEYISCRVDKIKIKDNHYCLVLLEDSTDVITTQHELNKEKRLLERRVNERTRALRKEIVEKEQAKKEAVIISNTDPLTGLPNRRAFTEVLENTVNLCVADNKRSFTLLFIDLDGFKIINDTLGHYAGDVTLIETAKRMQSLVRDNDFCARLAGDEFVIMLDGLSDEKKAINIVNKLLDEFVKPIDFHNHQKMSVSASIGVYLHTDNNNDASTILTMADEAMYEAKDRGKNCYVLFNENLKRRLQSTTVLKQNLDSAFINQEFMVYYQPICDVHGHILGAESLSRWKHKGQMISPAKFIPLLEQRGSIKEFTQFVIQEVFLTLLLHEDFPCVSVNLSMQQFYDDTFIDYVDEIFQELPQLRQRISFEITESLFHKDPHILSTGINELRKRGFRIYIDDFGTGYSSFSYIRNFKADVIKIDREFVIDIENNEKNADLLNGMIALLTSMDLDVVIEGIENEEQIKKIKSFNQHVKIQGFYFYKPMPLEQLLEVINQQQITH